MTQAAPALRDHHKAVTHQLILDAVSRCLEDVALSDLSFARVAAEAGIGERTIYRYFPNKEALLSAWWDAHKKQIGQEKFPDSEAALIAFPRRAFPLFDEEGEVIRGAVLSPEGRAMTLRANDKRQASIRSAVRAALPGIKEPDLTRYCAVVQLLQSATAWMTMKDYWNLDGVAAGEASAEAIATLFEAWRSERQKSEGRKP